MANSIHISTARTIMNSGDPFDCRAWKSDGSILNYNNCISIKYDSDSGSRYIKLLDSNQVRRLRDVCIFSINSLSVFL